MSRPSALAFDGARASSCLEENCSASTPDDESLCPESGSIGLHVDLVTVKALVKADALWRLDGHAYRFCPAPGCDIVYFDLAAGSIFYKQDMVVRVGQKETRDPVPLCYCFDYTVADLRREIAVRGRSDIPAIIAAEVRAGHCACEVKNPQGSCCLGNVTAATRSLSPAGSPS